MELNPEILYSALGHYAENFDFRQRYGKLLRRIIENHLNKHSKQFLRKTDEILFKTGSVNLSEVELELTNSVSESEADIYLTLLNTIKEKMNQFSVGFISEKLDEIFVSFELEKTIASLNDNPFSNLQKLKKSIFQIESTLEEVKVEESLDSDKIKDILERSQSESNVCYPVPELTHDLPIKGGDLGIIAGYTSVGKSWFLLNTWVESVRNNKNVIFISLELTKEHILPRLATILTGKRIFSNDNSLRYFNLLTKEVDEIEIETEDIDVLAGEVDSFLSKTNFFEPIRFTIYDLMSKIDAYISLVGSLDCVIIDGLEHIEVPEAKYKDTWQIVSKAVLRLKAIARKYNIAILTMSQVQKAKEQKKLLTIRDIAGGGEIGRVASVVLTLNQTPDEYIAKVMRINVAKQSHGFFKNTVYFVNTLFSIGKWTNCVRTMKLEDHDSLSVRISSSVKDIQALNFLDSDFGDLPNVEDL